MIEYPWQVVRWSVLFGIPLSFRRLPLSTALVEKAKLGHLGRAMEAVPGWLWGKGAWKGVLEQNSFENGYHSDLDHRCLSKGWPCELPEVLTSTPERDPVLAPWGCWRGCGCLFPPSSSDLPND